MKRWQIDHVFDPMTGKSIEKGRIVKPGSVKFDKDLHFQPYETSPYLQRYGVDYGIINTNDSFYAEDILRNGKEGRNGILWRPFFSYMMDEARFWMSRTDSGIRDLRDIGIMTRVGKPSDGPKIAKYGKRILLSPTENVIDEAVYKIRSHVFGKEVDYWADENRALVTIEDDGRGLGDEMDRTISVFYMDIEKLNARYKALLDGAILLSEKGVRMAGLSGLATFGMAWAVTVFTQHGLGKGHAIYVGDMDYDIVIPGPKTMIWSKDLFYFANLGKLKLGTPRTDMQSYVNFRYDREGLALELAKKFMNNTLYSFRNESELRKKFISTAGDIPVEEEDTWITRLAGRHGVSYLHYSGLERRVARFVMTKVLDCERGRIPMEGVAIQCFVLTPLDAIRPDLTIDLESTIPEGCICVPDLPAGIKVVAHRQPNENSNAFMVLTNVHRDWADRFRGQSVCFLGKGALEVLARLGGGDMDDSFIIIYDPVWVKAFETLRPYPETHKLEDSESKGLPTMLEERMLDELQSGKDWYSDTHVEWQIDLSKKTGVSLGSAVNFGAIDMILSDPDLKGSMVQDIKLRPDIEDEDKDEAIKYLLHRPSVELPNVGDVSDYQARLLTTNLERVIDGTVKDPSLLIPLGDVQQQIRDFHETCFVYPECMESRIPQYKRDAGDYILAKSLVCKSLDEMRALRDKVWDLLKEWEWDIATPADPRLRETFPYNTKVKKFVSGVGMWEWDYTYDDEGNRIRIYPPTRRNPEHPRTLTEVWNEGHLTRFARIKELVEAGEVDEAKALRATEYNDVVNEVKKFVKGFDDDSMMMIAIQLYYESYDPDKLHPDWSLGYTNVKDALLWSPVFAPYFVMALNRSKDAGYYHSIHIDQYYVKSLKDKCEMVIVRKGVVYVRDNKDNYTVAVGIVGNSCKLKDTDHPVLMDSGVIEFQKPTDICLPTDERLRGQKTVTRLYPPEGTKTETIGTDEIHPKFKALYERGKKILGLEDKK